MRSLSQSARCACPNALVCDQHDFDRCARLAIGNISSPTRFGAQRVGGDAARGRVDRCVRVERVAQALARSFGFDGRRRAYCAAYHAAIAADQTAAADRDEDRVEVGRLAASLAPERCPSPSSVSSSSKRGPQARPTPPTHALLGASASAYEIADDLQIRAVRADAIDLRWRRDRRHVDRAGALEPHRGIRDGRAVIPARRGDDAAGRHDRACSRLRERATRL